MCVRTLQFYSLSKFPLYNRVLSTLHETSDLVHLRAESLYASTSFHQPLPVSPPLGPATTTLPCVSVGSASACLGAEGVLKGELPRIDIQPLFNVPAFNF